MNILDVFSKKFQTPNFIKIRPVGAELFHADGRKDMAKLIVAFRNFANTSKMILRWNRWAVVNVVMTCNLVFTTLGALLTEHPWCIFYKSFSLFLNIDKKYRVLRNGRLHSSVEILNWTNTRLRIVHNGGVWLSIMTFSYHIISYSRTICWSACQNYIGNWNYTDLPVITAQNSSAETMEHSVSRTVFRGGNPAYKYIYIYIKGTRRLLQYFQMAGKKLSRYFDVYL